jgi:hypothetical protein
LKGLWDTAPYFHDGSALTLREVMRLSGEQHGAMQTLSEAEQEPLEAYLLQLDDQAAAPLDSSSPVLKGVRIKLRGSVLGQPQSEVRVNGSLARLSGNTWSSEQELTSSTQSVLLGVRTTQGHWLQSLSVRYSE